MKPPDEKVVVAGYIRVSTEHQANGEKPSPIVQREAIQNYAKDHSLALYRIYEDHESGKRVDRTNYSQMKKDAEAGRFKKVLFYKWDRFGRNTREVLTAHDDLEKVGIDIVCVAQNIDTSTGHGRFFMTQLAAFAELEWTQIRERTIMGLVKRANDGKPIGKVTFGYRWDKGKKAFVLNPDEAKVYGTIIDLFLTRNKSLLSIAKTLNENGHRTRYGKRWTQTSLGKVLRNPFYLGSHKYICQGTQYELPSPPLIDRRRWELIQDRIKENVRRSKNFDPNSPFILRGLLKCGECGYGFTPLVMGHDKEGNPYRFYKCYVANLRPSMRAAKNLRPGKNKCDLPTVNAVEIENYVLGSIFRFFMFPQNLIRLWKGRVNIDEAKNLESELRGNRAKLGSLESRREKVLDLYLDGEMDKEHLKKREDELKETIGRLREDIVELEGKLSEMSAMKERLNELEEMKQGIKKHTPAFKEAITRMTKKQLREFIEAALAGQRMTVSILRKGDISDYDDGLSAKELNEPVYRIHSGRKLLEWTVDEGNFDLVSAAEYLRPLIGEYIPKLGL